MGLLYRERGVSSTHFDIVSGDLVIGTLYQGTRPALTNQPAFWHWTFFVMASPPGFEHRGTAADREIACLAIERNWEVWLKAARLTEAG